MKKMILIFILLPFLFYSQNLTTIKKNVLFYSLDENPPLRISYISALKNFSYKENDTIFTFNVVEYSRIDNKFKIEQSIRKIISNVDENTYYTNKDNISNIDYFNNFDYLITYNAQELLDSFIDINSGIYKFKKTKNKNEFNFLDTKIINERNIKFQKEELYTSSVKSRLNLLVLSLLEKEPDNIRTVDIEIKNKDIITDSLNIYFPVFDTLNIQTKLNFPEKYSFTDFDVNYSIENINTNIEDSFKVIKNKDNNFKVLFLKPGKFNLTQKVFNNLLNRTDTYSKTIITSYKRPIEIENTFYSYNITLLEKNEIKPIKIYLKKELISNNKIKLSFKSLYKIRDAEYNDEINSQLISIDLKNDIYNISNDIKNDDDLIKGNNKYFYLLSDKIIYDKDNMVISIIPPKSIIDFEVSVNYIDKNNLESTYKKESFYLMNYNELFIKPFLGIELNKIYFYHPIKTINETNKSIPSLFYSLNFNFLMSLYKNISITFGGSVPNNKRKYNEDTITNPSKIYFGVDYSIKDKNNYTKYNISTGLENFSKNFSFVNFIINFPIKIPKTKIYLNSKLGIRFGFPLFENDNMLNEYQIYSKRYNSFFLGINFL